MKELLEKLDQRGYVLMIVLVTSFVILSVGTTMVITSRFDTQSAGNELQKTRTHLAASGALSIIAQQFKDNPDSAQIRYCPGEATGCGSVVGSSTGLIGYWKQDETSGTTAYDSSGNSKTGAVANGTWEAAGKLCGASKFNGSSSKITIDNFSGISSSEITVAAWVKAEDITNRKFIWYTNETSGYSKFRLYVASGNWIGEVGNGSVNVKVQSTATLNEWVHLALTVKGGGSLALFVNGVSKASATYSQVGGRSSTSHIGAEAATNWWKGLIDDMRVYNRILSNSEIQELAAGAMNSPQSAPSLIVVGADTVQYGVKGCGGSGPYTITTDAYGGTALEKRFASKLTRIVGGVTQDVTAPKPQHFAAFRMCSDLFIGKLDHEFVGSSPIFTGNIYTSGQIFIDNSPSPVYFGYNLDGKQSAPTCASQASVIAGIQGKNCDGIQETCTLFTEDGKLNLSAGVALLTRDVFINQKAAVNCASRNAKPGLSTDANDLIMVNSDANFPISAGCPDLKCGTYTSVGNFLSTFQTNGATLEEAARSAGLIIKVGATLELKYRGSSISGVSINDIRSTQENYYDGLPQILYEDWFYDWNVRKKAMVLIVNMSALKAKLLTLDAADKPDFNGIVYIEHNFVTNNTLQFAGVQFLNCEDPPYCILTNEGVPVKQQVECSGTTIEIDIKGLTVATPHTIYTVGSVNNAPYTCDNPPINLAFISDMHTILSKSWSNYVSRWNNAGSSRQDTLDMIATMVLCNQSAAGSGEMVTNYSDAAWKIGDVNSLPSNDFGDDVGDRYWNYASATSTKRRAYRREPRNNPIAQNCPGDRYCHFDTTSVVATIISGYSFPTDNLPPNSIYCESYSKDPTHGCCVPCVHHEMVATNNAACNDGTCSQSACIHPGTGSANLALLRSMNKIYQTGTGFTSANIFSKTQVRFGDAIRFLEHWHGRSETDIRWSHPVKIVGTSSFLWETTPSNRGINWNVTWETVAAPVNWGNHYIILKEPQANPTDWIGEYEWGEMKKKGWTMDGYRYSAYNQECNRQLKIGSANLPSVLFVHYPCMAPGMICIETSSVTSSETTQKHGTWRRDYGKRD